MKVILVLVLLTVVYTWVQEIWSYLGQRLLRARSPTRSRALLFLRAWKLSEHSRPVWTLPDTAANLQIRQAIEVVRLRSEGPGPSWDDHAAWDAHYADLNASSIIDSMAIRFALRKMPTTAKRIWMPGCGASVTPAVWAACGLTVVATDVSTRAIRLQTELSRLLSNGHPLLDRCLVETGQARPGPPCELEVKGHDFRTSLEANRFDLIYNERAFQGLPAENMKLAARSFFAALAPGGRAIFETINTRVPVMNEIEDALLQAGFHVPYSDIDRWYRQSLDSTNERYVMILGGPRRKHDTPERFWRFRDALGQSKLDYFRAEYEERRALARADEDRALLDPNLRIAFVVYSTG